MSNVGPRPAKASLDMGAVFDEYFDYVTNTLRRLGVHEADLKDLVHEIFLKIHLRSSDYDPRRPLQSWLFGFAYRVAADHRRLARHRLEVIGQPGDAVSAEQPADELIEERQDRALALEALEAVEVERRAVLILHDLDEVPIREIAETLGILPNTANSRLRRARIEFAAAAKRLRKARGDS
jgi:RNA polymerase sigma-70 factor, ECF subfamily